MKINAISGTGYSNMGIKKVNRVHEVSDSGAKKGSGIAIISFRGGNKEQAIFYGPEMKPYYGIGGVSTVMQDMRNLRVSNNSPVMDDAYKKTFEFYAPKDKVMVDALYNGQKIYDPKTNMLTNVQVAKIPDDLPETSAFKKYSGKYFMTNMEKFQSYASPKEFFEHEEKIIKATNKPNLNVDGNIFILDDVTGSSKKMMEFGDGSESEIKLFRVLRYDKEQKKMRPTNDFKIYTDLTASMKKPYGDGSYSTSPKPLGQSWMGDPYAKNSKAFVEFLPRICEVTGEGGAKFDPATVVLNDAQASWASEYMARKAAGGEEFWKGKKPTMILHNGGDSYTQVTSFQNMFVDIADKDLKKAVENDPKYIEALKRGPDYVNNYFKELIPAEMLDSQGGVSAFKNALYYVDHGYMPVISTVSEGYQKGMANNPEICPAAYAQLHDLDGKGKFKGILNAFENADMNPYQLPGMDGYKQENHLGQGTTINGQDGFKTRPYVAFDPSKVNENSVDIAHVREVKRQNKISLLERLDKDVLEKLGALKEVKGHEYDFNIAVTGLTNKNAKVYGYIDKKYLDEVKKPNSDVKVITSWGRGDVQKGLDSVLASFENYVIKNGKKDPNTLLVMGGALTDSPDSVNIMKIIKRMNENPELKGRFVYLDGFAPNKPLAMASDFSVFPSRFAPCELTDLESMKVFSAPIVTNCQGLAQKNFDASIAGEADKVTGYKTVHEYDMSFNDLKNSLPDKASREGEKTKGDLDNVVKKFYDQVRKQTPGGDKLSENEVMDIVRKDKGLSYNYRYNLTKPFRDQVIENELTHCYERALIQDRNSEVQTKMVQNHLKQHTEWELNSKLSATGKSSADLYREYHFQSEGKPVHESDTLLHKLRENCRKKGVFERTKADIKFEGSSKTSGIFTGSSKKYAIAALGVAVIAGLGAVGYKNGWFSPKFAEDKKDGNLSCVG